MLSLRLVSSSWPLSSNTGFTISFFFFFFFSKMSTHLLLVINSQIRSGHSRVLCPMWVDIIWYYTSDYSYLKCLNSSKLSLTGEQIPHYRELVYAHRALGNNFMRFLLCFSAATTLVQFVRNRPRIQLVKWGTSPSVTHFSHHTV